MTLFHRTRCCLYDLCDGSRGAERKARAFVRNSGLGGHESWWMSRYFKLSDLINDRCARIEYDAEEALDRLEVDGIKIFVDQAALVATVKRDFAVQEIWNYLEY